ncbi:recombinase zinc beta ribbon domain-containing protein, partial [Paenirhodobacter populi]|uniref:recombinase zinc beta ribbon domain-containing protein n=1 Tax=Paenirhodobacter populi TaxID=2306993 RepID=UPI0019D4AF54
KPRFLLTGLVKCGCCGGGFSTIGKDRFGCSNSRNKGTSVCDNRVSRLNPEAEWIVKDVPELRIVDDELWQAVRARQGVIAEKFANVTEAVRAHHRKNRLNGARRPKSLLSGLVFCGCCGGPYSLRGADRFACSNHIGKGTCTNSRGITREELETRVLAGLKDRMMSPQIAAEAMRAHAEETNRLNRERRSNGDA